MLAVRNRPLLKVKEILWGSFVVGRKSCSGTECCVGGGKNVWAAARVAYCRLACRLDAERINTDGRLIAKEINMESKTKVQLSPADIQPLVNHAFGHRPLLSVREMTDGWFNTAYHITLGDERRQTVLKVGPLAEFLLPKIHDLTQRFGGRLKIQEH